MVETNLKPIDEAIEDMWKECFTPICIFSGVVASIFTLILFLPKYGTTELPKIFVTLFSIFFFACYALLTVFTIVMYGIMYDEEQKNNQKKEEEERLRKIIREEIKH
jgi:hypothetical protein